MDAGPAKAEQHVKKNSTLYPMLLVLADELCNLYVKGCQATDVTRPVGHSERQFTLRCLLLFWSVRTINF
jgi:hypothetical protein